MSAAEKYTNDHGKECYRGVSAETPFSAEYFHMPERQEGDGENFAFHSELGSLTVVDRMTGFGHRDIESGYRDPEGKFWLASGNYDVRESGCKTVGEAIQWVKERANTCDPDYQPGPAKNTAEIQWQPIDTAPKDGSVFATYSPRLAASLWGMNATTSPSGTVSMRSSRNRAVGSCASPTGRHWSHPND